MNTARTPELPDNAADPRPPVPRRSVPSDALPGRTAAPDAAPGRTAPPDPAPLKPGPPKPALVFDDPLDRQSLDDTDAGWGERPATSDNSAADLARFLDEKPPHHL